MKNKKAHDRKELECEKKQNQRRWHNKGKEHKQKQNNGEGAQQITVEKAINAYLCFC